jgi:hypothetical protein
MLKSPFVFIQRSRLLSFLLLSTLLPLASYPAFGQSAEKTQAAVAEEFPNQYFSENIPSADVMRFYPQQWTTYGSNAGRNAVFSVAEDAPSDLKGGVQWSFAGAGAIPLDGPPLANDFKTTAYTIGMPVGVAVVAGMVFVGDDNGYTYALNAVNGKLIWARMEHDDEQPAHCRRQGIRLDR